MALSTLRLRRALSLSSSLFKLGSLSTLPSATIHASSLLANAGNTRPLLEPSAHFHFQSVSFHSSPVSHFSSRFNDSNDKITEDTILFEGCDYNHWLITMEFPKDPKPTAEQMVQTYVETCAKGLGCSIEEAKKKMYACSTTTYQGFQAVMTEEESEKFRGLPGVVFILPDSYIDPVNKEYGGDKYINGTIVPRPPPIQYRQTRTRDRSPRQPRNQQWGGPSYDQQGDVHGYPVQRNYGPPGQSDGRGYGPSGQNDGRGYGPPGGTQFPQGDRMGQMPMGGRDYSPGSYQGERRDAVPPNQGAYQGAQGSFSHQGNRDLRGEYGGAGPVAGGDQRQGGGPGHGQNYAGPGEAQRFGGNFGHGGNPNYSQGFGGDQRLGRDSGYGNNYGGPANRQGFSHTGNMNSDMQAEQPSFSSDGQTGRGQGQY